MNILSWVSMQQKNPIGKFRPTVMGFAESAQLDDFWGSRNCNTSLLNSENSHVDTCWGYWWPTTWCLYGSLILKLALTSVA